MTNSDVSTAVPDFGSIVPGCVEDREATNDSVFPAARERNAKIDRELRLMLLRRLQIRFAISVS